MQIKIRGISYLKSFFVVAVSTLLVGLFKNILPSRDLIMFYLLGVVVVALRWGQGPAIAASILSVVIFDYFFVHPAFSIMATVAHDWLALAVFLVVGVSTSILTAQARKSAQTTELLSEKQKLQTILLNSISHDLRTPLVSIKGVLSSLLESKSPGIAAHQEMIETAYEDSDRLNRLVGNLLDITRVEAGALKMTAVECDVKDLIGVSLQEFPQEKIRNRAFNIMVGDELPDVTMDLTLMSKVLTNLIDNALKYSPDSSPVEIEMKLDGNNLCFSVADSGCGIPEADLTRVFDKFYRGNQNIKVPGTGLGLSICKGIVEAHRGNIWVESRKGHGTKVVVTIPVTGSGRTGGHSEN